MYEKLMTLRNTTTWHLCAGSWLPGNCRTISHKHASPHFRENRRKKQMQWAIVIAAFLASAVEFVEAFTLVLVAGITVNWRSAIVGALAAVATLAVIIATLGVTLVTLVPLDVLRFVIGFLLLLFGLKWLKNAIQRYSGLKLLHDEEAIYAARVAEARARGEPVKTRLDTFGVLLSYKSVLLEGLEVAFIVISFGGSRPGGNRGRYPGASPPPTHPGEHLEVYCRHHAHYFWHVLVGGELRHQLAIL